MVARHERGRTNANRRHQSRNAVQNRGFSLAEETFSTSCTLITPMPRILLLFRRLVHLQVVQPACPEAGQSANMCKRPPFEARGRTMIRGGSGEGSTLLTLFKNIQQCCDTLCSLFLSFIAKRFPWGSTSIEEVTLEKRAP